MADQKAEGRAFTDEKRWWLDRSRGIWDEMDSAYAVIMKLAKG